MRPYTTNGKNKQVLIKIHKIKDKNNWTQNVFFLLLKKTVTLFVSTNHQARTAVMHKKLVIFGCNRCPFPLLRSYKKRTRGRLDRNVAPCSRPTTNVIGPLHECKKVCPCTKALPQSGIRAWIKQGRKKRKKRGRETEARRLMERKAKQNTSEELGTTHVQFPDNGQTRIKKYKKESISLCHFNLWGKLTVSSSENGENDD